MNVTHRLTNLQRQSDEELVLIEDPAETGMVIDA